MIGLLHPAVVRAARVFPQMMAGPFELKPFSLRMLIDAYWENPTEEGYDAILGLAVALASGARMSSDKVIGIYFKVMFELGASESPTPQRSKPIRKGKRSCK